MEGDEFAGAGGHGNLLSLTQQIYQLHQEQIEGFPILAQGHSPGIHPIHVAVVVRAPEIDDPLKTAEIFVLVVSQIRGKVGGHAVGPHHHSIFFIPKRCRSEPKSTILFVDMACHLQGFDHPLHRSAFIQAFLAKPPIVMDPKFLEIFSDTFEDALARIVTKH